MRRRSLSSHITLRSRIALTACDLISLVEAKRLLRVDASLRRKKMPNSSPKEREMETKERKVLSSSQSRRRVCSPPLRFLNGHLLRGAYSDHSRQGWKDA